MKGRKPIDKEVAIMDEKPKVAIYVRVSTKGQELDNQLIQLKSYCEKSNWEVYELYQDVITGKEESRPSYDKMFRDAHKKLFDGVLFWALDRFARSGTLFTLQKLKEFDNLGIFWHSYQDPYISTAGEWKDVIISIMSTLAKIESKRISKRTKAGLERVKAQGKKLGRSPVPKSAIVEVEKYLSMSDPPAYRRISELVMYKIKHGAIRHVSVGQIAKIAKSVQKRGV